MTLDELNPELFIWELYNSCILWFLEDALYSASRFGFCDASRLPVLPSSGEFALMIEWPDGEKYWAHISATQLSDIRSILEERSR